MSTVIPPKSALDRLKEELSGGNDPDANVSGTKLDTTSLGGRFSAGPGYYPFVERLTKEMISEFTVGLYGIEPFMIPALGFPIQEFPSAPVWSFSPGRQPDSKTLHDYLGKVLNKKAPPFYQLQTSSALRTITDLARELTCFQQDANCADLDEPDELGIAVIRHILQENHTTGQVFGRYPLFLMDRWLKKNGLPYFRDAGEIRAAIEHLNGVDGHRDMFFTKEYLATMNLRQEWYNMVLARAKPARATHGRTAKPAPVPLTTTNDPMGIIFGETSAPGTTRQQLLSASLPLNFLFRELNTLTLNAGNFTGFTDSMTGYFIPSKRPTESALLEAVNLFGVASSYALMALYPGSIYPVVWQVLFSNETWAKPYSAIIPPFKLWVHYFARKFGVKEPDTAFENILEDSSSIVLERRMKQENFLNYFLKALLLARLGMMGKLIQRNQQAARHALPDTVVELHMANSMYLF